MIKNLLIATLLLLTAGCASQAGNKTAAVENPYIESAKTHTANGMVAMRQERWEMAERIFTRALTAAQLADDQSLVIRGWYNLASARAAGGRHDEATEAYLHAIELASRHAHPTMQMRALLALRLMQQREQRLPSDFTLNALPESLFSANEYAPDLQLMAARLAQRLQQPVPAERGFRSVVNRSGNTHDLLKIKAEAHMGLALLAQASDQQSRAMDEAEQAIALCHRIGAPRLTAHALLLKSELAENSSIALDSAERSLAIYAALNNSRGERAAIQRLLDLDASTIGDEKRRRLQLRLQSLEDKLGRVR